MWKAPNTYRRIKVSIWRERKIGTYYIFLHLQIWSFRWYTDRSTVMLGDELGHAIVCYPNQIISGALSNCDSSWIGSSNNNKMVARMFCSRFLPLLLHSHAGYSQVEPEEPGPDNYLFVDPFILLLLPAAAAPHTSSPTKNPIRNHSIPFNLHCCFFKMVANRDGRWLLL